MTYICHQDVGSFLAKDQRWLDVSQIGATQEGKRHVKTVPVRLCRPQNNLRKAYPDRPFAAESYNTGKRIVEAFGPKAAVFVSQDDKK